MQGMDKLDRLEALAQRLIEGTFNRLSTLFDNSDTILPGQVEIKTDSVSASPAFPPAEARRRDKTDTKEILALTPSDAARRWRLQLGERRLRLGEPVVRIGRALDNDIIVNDPTVSAYHAQLRWRDGRYYLCPPIPTVDGETGVEVPHTHQQAEGKNAQTTHKPVNQKALASGDVIKLGHTVLTVVVETKDAERLKLDG